MKLMTAFLSGLLIFTLAGCSTGGAESSAAEAPSAQESESAMESESGSASTEESSEASDSTAETLITKGESVSNEYFEMTVAVESENDLDSPIKSRVTIKNISDSTLAYVKGSGSNLAPDALTYSIDSFAPMYKPAMMTMDYRTELLEPGESLELDLDFAPYIPKDPDALIGNDKDIEYFKSDDFTPAEPGTYDGKAVFECRVVPEDAAPDALLAGFEDYTPVSAELDFAVTIQ